MIFVHGCFWHRHPDPGCRLARLPKSRLDFWEPKLAANTLRDGIAIDKLDKLRWKVLVIWECELKDRTSLKSKIESFFHDEID